MAATEQRAWRRSTRCDSSACVEVAPAAAGVHVRDGKRPDGPQLSATRGEWAAFLRWVKDAGEDAG
jgi:hypothetical protein